MGVIGVVFVPLAEEGDSFAVVFWVPECVASVRAITGAAKGSAVVTAMVKATTTLPSDAPSFLNELMIGISAVLRTEALRMAMPGSFVFTIRPP